MKTCRVCGKEKPLSEYHKKSDMKDGKQSQCKVCNISRAKKWQKENPERHTQNWQRLTDGRDPLVRKAREYNIHPDDLRDLLNKSEGRCEICTRIPTRWVVIDHCHSGLNVRGILCETCNQGLGLFGDSVKTMKSAIEYLSKPTLIYRKYEAPPRQKYK